MDSLQLKEYSEKIHASIGYYTGMLRDLNEKFGSTERHNFSDAELREATATYMFYENKIACFEAVLEALPGLTVEQADQELETIRRMKKK